MAKFEVGDEFVSEGHRFKVKAVTGSSITAEELSTGRTREASVQSEREGEADLEWLDGDPRWHQKGEALRRQPVVATPSAGPSTGPSRFDRDDDIFGDD